jgi:hypothetical protein
VAVVVRLMELLDLRDSPPASDDAMVVELTDEPAALGKFWSMILLLAIRDNATSVHYHPWREDGVLAYIVANVRHELSPPPDELSEAVVTMARSLFTEPVQGGLLARLGGLLARLGGRTVSGLSCGAVEFDVGGNMLLWDAVVWSSGERAGVELFRVAPPVTEQMHAEPGAPQQIAWEQLMDLWNRSSRSN